MIAALFVVFFIFASAAIARQSSSPKQLLKSLGKLPQKGALNAVAKKMPTPTFESSNEIPLESTVQNGYYTLSVSESCGKDPYFSRGSRSGVCTSNVCGTNDDDGDDDVVCPMGTKSSSMETCIGNKTVLYKWVGNFDCSGTPNFISTNSYPTCKNGVTFSCISDSDYDGEIPVPDSMSKAYQEASYDKSSCSGHPSFYFLYAADTCITSTYYNDDDDDDYQDDNRDDNRDDDDDDDDDGVAVNSFKFTCDDSEASQKTYSSYFCDGEINTYNLPQFSDCQVNDNDDAGGSGANFDDYVPAGALSYYYATSDTKDARQNVSVAGPFTVCSGTKMVASMCDNGGECRHNTYLRIVDNTGKTLKQNADTCDGCSLVSYSPPNSGCMSGIQLWMGCHGSSSCSGKVIVTGTSGGTMLPTIVPTAAPTYDSFIYTEQYLVTTCLDSSSSSTASLSSGAIAGIVIGSIAFVAAIAFGIWYYLIKYKPNPLSSPMNTL